MNTATRLWLSTRLLDQISEQVRHLHHSLKTVKACLKQTTAAALQVTLTPTAAPPHP